MFTKHLAWLPELFGEHSTSLINNNKVFSWHTPWNVISIFQTFSRWSRTNFAQNVNLALNSECIKPKVVNDGQVLTDCCLGSYTGVLFVFQIFERILYIWAIRHPASGYVQGINDLVTPFFVVFLSEFIENGEYCAT